MYIELLGNPYDVLKVLLWPPYGPKGPIKVPYGSILLLKKEANLLLKKGANLLLKKEPSS